jgi:hypothetical protein
MNLLLRAGVVAVILFVSVATGRADDTMIYYHIGSWDAFSGRSDSGQPLCGIGTADPANGRSLSMRFALGGSAVEFTAGKPGWAIPVGTRMTVVMQLGSAAPWTELVEGDGRRLRWSMDQTAVQVFDTQFRRASSLALMFPDGNEPAWTLPLTGSTAIDDAFGRCITDLTRRTQGGAPAGGPPATQPFGKGAAPPSPAPPAKP